MKKIIMVTLLALTASVSAVAGNVDGKTVTFESVIAFGTDVYHVNFKRGEVAVVVVKGDGDTDLDLRIYDSRGNLVCSDIDYTDMPICSWEPRREGTYRIEVENLGSVYNEYVIITN